MSAPIRLTKDQLFAQYFRIQKLNNINLTESQARAAFEVNYRANQEIKRGVTEKIEIVQVKECSKCKETLEVHLFTKSRFGKFGVSKVCRDCRNEETRKRYAMKASEKDEATAAKKAERIKANKEKREKTNARVKMLLEEGFKKKEICEIMNFSVARFYTARREIVLVPTKKQCSCCKKKLKLDNFSKISANKDGLNRICRKCTAIKKKKYRDNPKPAVAKKRLALKELILKEHANGLNRHEVAKKLNIGIDTYHEAKSFGER